MQIPHSPNSKSVSSRLKANSSEKAPKTQDAKENPGLDAYDQPPMDELFKGSSPQWGKKYNKYIASTQVPHSFESDKAYFDAEADQKIASQYYGDLDKLSPEDRMSALRDLVSSSHTPEPKGYHYIVAKHLYNSVDQQPDGTIRSVYNREPIKLFKYPDISLNTLSENDIDSIAGASSSAPEVIGAWLAFQNGNAELNCEHVVPQSYFGKKEPMRSDMHHLYSCDIGENSSRGSTKYGKFVPRGGKGEVARATLYFMLRYPDIRTPYNSKDVEMLKDWSTQDPPSIHEKRRNHQIQKVQGNRNPFIDNPEWLADFSR